MTITVATKFQLDYMTMTGQTILWRCITQTDYRVITIYTMAACGTHHWLQQQCNPGQLSQP